MASSSAAGSQILYQVLNVTSSGTAANHTDTLTETNYGGVVAVGSTNVSVSASSNYTAGTDSARVTVSGSGGTLVFVSVVQSGETQLIWAGTMQLSSGTTDVFNGLAYVNGSEPASVVMGFATANGTQDVNATLGTSANSTLSLPKITFSHTSSAKVNAQVNVVIPIRYASLTIDGEAAINASASIATPLLSAGVSEFGNATYPDIVWQGNVSSTISVDSANSPATASARTAEFFGINGTIVGYVQIANLASNHTLTTGGGLVTKVQAYSSSTLIVWSTAPSSQTGDMTGVAGIRITIGGQPVVVRIGTSGQVQSSANVQTQRQVTANGSSSYRLVLLNTTSTVRSYFLLGISGNEATRVGAITLAGERQTTITVNSTVYPATQVNVTATSGAITFNLTSSYSRITVFKVTALGVVELKSSNYWEVNGSVYVFDDPSSTYYVANAAAAGQTTTATTTAATTSSSSTSASVTTVSSTQTSSQSSETLSTASGTSHVNTLSSATGTTTTTTSAAATTITTTSTGAAITQSSSSSSSLDSYVVIAVLAAIVVCALLFMALRRRSGAARQTAV